MKFISDRNKLRRWPNLLSNLFFFNTIVFTMLININVVNIIHLWRLINRIWPINGAASTPAVQTVWSVVEMKALNFYGVSTDWSFSAAKTSRSVYLGEKVERQLFCPAPRLLACQRTGKHSALWRRPKKVSATFRSHTELVVPCAETRQAVEAGEKTDRYLSHTQSCLFRALGQGKLWSCIRNLAPTFLLTDESVCTAGLLRPSFIRYIRFVKGQKWIILNTFIVFNIVNKMVLKKHQISEYKAMFFNKFFTMHLYNLQSTDFSTDVSS